ncbi:MAG: XylR N-terminal domain-containing protein, partial [Chitinispirillaceae bacterium]|nr:XylR N-terminal domain-containing protein [Chitinispirillaceae bacterium]
MHVEDLNHKELLELDPEGGGIRFAGQRALLLDAVAMGLLRQQIVKDFGLNAARAILTRFGFAHGWRMAEALKKEFRWNREEWYRAGPRILVLGGFFAIHPGSDDPLASSGMTLLASYEAEQHLALFSHSDNTVCWTICGFMSGYRSYIAGTEIYVLEDRCLAQGHAACHFVGHTRKEWGEKNAGDLIFYDSKDLTECLDISLAMIIKTLKASEEKLRAHHQALIHIAPSVDESLGIIAISLAMRQVVELARRIAKVDAPVLITGESGT